MRPMAANNQERSFTETETNQKKITIFFTLCNNVGELCKALEVLKDHQVNLDHINSKQNKERREESDFILICDISGGLKGAMEGLKHVSKNLKIISVPWFPKHTSDLDKVVPKTFSCDKELDADHPGFKDDDYKKRRAEVAAMSRNYKHDQEIPRVDYTDKEINTWRTVYSALVKLYPDYACERFNINFELLQTKCGYSPDNIPQLEDVSKFLQNRTGFRLRPAPGLISPRDFLAALAFRTFYSTQYIRHYSRPEYTPEPDVCHELLGHVPLFADEEFAQFAQEIGLASLGAPLEYIKVLSRLYWFTVEVGLWKEAGETKVYGAALLSSAEELEFCLRNAEKIKTLDPAEACKEKIQPSKIQPYYFVAESFETVKEIIREFATTNPRPFDVKSTQSVEVIYQR